MKAPLGPAYRRKDTRLSRDGRTVSVRLRVDRRSYEFARQWAAAAHSGDHYTYTAEDQLESYLDMALLSHMDEMDWFAPPLIAALYPQHDEGNAENDFDDDIPF